MQYRTRTSNFLPLKAAMSSSMLNKSQVFMTRQDILTCVHEPFGDAFYFGPERLSCRYENDPEARKASGFAESTFKTVFDRIEKESEEV
jgi:hypothetical protein